MLIDEKSVRELLRRRGRGESWKMVCSPTLHGVCAMAILAEVLRKELVAHEVAFGSEDEGRDLVVVAGGEELELRGTAAGLCECDAPELGGPAIAFGVAKALNVVNVQTVWPLAVAYGYYRGVLGGDWAVPTDEKETGICGPGESKGRNKKSNLKENKEKENKGNTQHQKREEAKAAKSAQQPTCEWCASLHGRLVGSVKMLASKSSGVFFKKISALGFAKASSLLDALKHDLSFLLGKRLFLVGPKTADRRIRETLARSGISNAVAAERLGNIPHAIRERILAVFGTRGCFVRRLRLGQEITADEHAWLILSLLSCGQPLDAVLSLGEQQTAEMCQAVAFYQAAIGGFKGAIASARQMGRIVVLQPKGIDPADQKAPVIFRVVSRLCSAYFNRRTGGQRSSPVPLLLAKYREPNNGAASVPSQLALYSTSLNIQHILTRANIPCTSPPKSPISVIAAKELSNALRALVKSANSL